jgi:radical SAM protein with 4Fe4S-binding SPASM domain
MKSRSYAGILKTGHPLLSKKPPLVRLDMELTERCGNNCIHCYIRQPEQDARIKKREMTTEKIKNILTEAASLGCLDVRLTGGEPLLRPDFPEIYTFARKLGIRVELFTNATRIDRSLCRLYSRIPPLKPIEVTLYGMRRESYERVTRTPGSFNAAMQGIRLLSEYAVPFHIKGVLIPPDETEMKQMEAWAAGLPGDIPPPHFAVYFDLRARRDSPSRNQAIRRLRLSPDIAIAVQSRHREEWLSDRRNFCRHFLNPSGDALFACGAGSGYLAVDPYGTAQPCLLLRHPDMQFDLHTGTLKQALDNYAQILPGHKAQNPVYKEKCARCFLSPLCEQCPAKAWMEHGTLDTPVDYYCAAAHEEAVKLGLLNPGEEAWKICNWRERLNRLFPEKEKGDENGKKTGS